MRDAADRIVIVSGDTDLIPAIRTAKDLFPDKTVWCAFPYKRHNRELELVCDGHFRIKKQKYPAHQLPDPVLKDGRRIRKPSPW